MNPGADVSVSLWALLAAACAGVALLVSGGLPLRFTRPSVLVGAMAIAMVTFGSWSYYATTQFFPHFHAPIDRALVFAAVGLGAAALGVRLTRVLPAREPRAVRWSWTPAPLDLAIWILLALCVVGTLASIARIGYIPILRGDIREERLYYAAQAGPFFRMSLLGTSAAILGGVRWLAFGRSSLAALSVPLGLLCTSLYGPRFFPFVALGVLFICYDSFVRRVTPRNLAIGLGIVVALGIGGAIRRERAGTFVFDRPGVSIDARTAALAVGYVSVPEFRDFAWSLDYFADPARRLHGSTLGGAIVPLLPGRVWSLVGVDKEALYSRDSATLMAEILQVDTGIRIGIMGELYMNFGLAGIAVGMLLFGLFVGWLDRRLGAASLLDPLVPLYALVTLVSVFALIGILNMFASSVVLFGWPLLLAAFLGARPVSAPAAEPAA
jgi:hypothetical protein